MIKFTLTGVTLLMLAAPSHAAENPDKAKELLKKVASTLQAAKTISVVGMATAEEVEPSEDFKLEKQFAVSVKFERPNKLFAKKMGDENQIAYFDGKSLTVVDPVAKKYGQTAVEGSVDALATKLEDLNIQAPLVDLLQSNLMEIAQKSVLKSKYLGPARVGIRTCEHVAFRTAVADWQLWIDEARGTICKSVVTTRALAQAPEYQVTFGNWKFDADYDDAIFTAVIPSGAEQVNLTPGSFR